jgi:UDP-glucose 4-epimerase
VRDYIHVVDLAVAHVQAIGHFTKLPEGNVYEVFNLGTGIGVSVLELVDKFQTVTGVKLNYTIGPRRPGDVEKVYADPAKVNKVLGWKTKFSIDEALLHAWQWEKALPAAR